MARPQDHIYGCHIELCPSFCRCWCHDGKNGNPTLPPTLTPVAPGKHVQVSLKLNDQVVSQWTVGVDVRSPILIDPGPMSVRSIDRLTIEVELLR